MSIENEIKEYFEEDEWNDMSDFEKALFTDFNSTIEIFPTVKEEIKEEPIVIDITDTDYTHNDVAEINNKDKALNNNISDITENEENKILYCPNCKQKYTSFCLNCPMLVHILDNDVRIDICDRAKRTLPKEILIIAQSMLSINQLPGVFASCTIPKDVRFGPCLGLEFIQRNSGCAFQIRHNRFVKSKKNDYSNWTQYVNFATRKSDGNLNMFQQENNLYFRSSRRILKGEELLVYFDQDKWINYNEKQRIFYFPIEENNTKCIYACTYCCLGFNMEIHLKNHKSVCPYITLEDIEPIKEIVQCPFCMIYLDEKEYLGFHMTCCCEKHSRKCVLPNNPDRTTVPSSSSIKIVKRNENIKSTKISMLEMYNCYGCNYRTKYYEEFKTHVCLEFHNKQVKYKVKSVCVNAQKPASQEQDLKQIEFVTAGYTAKMPVKRAMHITERKNNKVILETNKLEEKMRQQSSKASMSLGKSFPYKKFSDRNHYENYQNSFETFVNVHESVQSKISNKPNSIQQAQTPINTLNNIGSDTPVQTNCSKKPVLKNISDIIVVDSSSDDDNSKNETSTECNSCKFKCFSKKELEEHTKKHRNYFLLEDDSEDFIGFPKSDQKININNTEDLALNRHAVKRHENDKEFLKKHEEINPEVYYECAHCGKRYFVKDELVKHIRLCSISKRSTNKRQSPNNGHHRLEYRCKLCSFETNHSRSFRWHKSNVHGLQEDAIAIMKYSFDDEVHDLPRKSSNSNRSNRTETGPFICTTCNEGFLYKKHLEKHVIDNNHEVKIKTPISRQRKRIIKEDQIEKKILKITTDKGDLYQCKSCQEVYRQHHTVKVHLLNKHAINDNKTKLKCSKCNFKTDYKCNLKRHLYLHESIKPFECRICQRKFNRKNHLDKHNMNYHSNNIDIFQCKDCSNTYNHKESLKRHMKEVHNCYNDNINTFKCKECSNIYNHKESLRRHFKKMHQAGQNHNVDIFKCKQCYTTYNDKQSLISHRKEVHKPTLRVIKCTDCSNTYRHKKSLRRHRKKVH